VARLGVARPPQRASASLGPLVCRRVVRRWPFVARQRRLPVVSPDPSMAAADGEGGPQLPDGAGSGRSSQAPASGWGSGGEQPQVLRFCDFRDFLRHLGVDPRVDASGLVMVAAHFMFAAALPTLWSEQIDDGSARVYFFNKVSGESLWVHPQSELFKEIMAEIRNWPPDEPLDAIFARSDTHLRQAHRNAIETIAQWSAYDAPQGPEEAPEFGESAQFFFNATTGESLWSDPRQSVEFDLRQRHSILCECIAAHTQNLSKMARGSMSSGSSDAENEQDGVQALVANLWQSIGSLPLPVRREASASPPGDAGPPNSGRRPANLPAGDDTVRSSISYFTARSSGSCSPRN